MKLEYIHFDTLAQGYGCVVVIRWGDERRLLIIGLALVADGEDIDHICFRFKAVQGDIA